MNLFETKISFERNGERGALEVVNVVYVFQAETFGDAENKTVEMITPFLSGGYEVKSVKRAKIAELFFDADSEKWFKARINFLYVDEKGKEKKVGSVLLVQADNIKEARERIDERMQGTMADWELAKIEETAIMEVVLNAKPE